MTKFLYWDSETSPISGYVWSLWDQSLGLSQIIEPTHMICYGASWREEKSVEVRSIYRDGKQAMLQRLWDRLDQADAVVSWNGKAFDTKHANREFIEAGMTPPSPYKEVDLMLTVKNKFKAPSNKLDYWSGLLLGRQKVQHSGFQLWKDCMAGDERAWKLMYKYQRGDVTLLKDLHRVLLPWISGHPDGSLYDGDADGCPRCGAQNFQARGTATTGTAKYRRYQCQECGGWFRGKTNIQTTEFRTL